MATNGYPHLVFVQPEPGLDKGTLAELLGRLFPGAPVEDRPLRLDLDLSGYVFSFWFEDAEGVAERYATYLPEGARRRWLARCETMIDFHGAEDAQGAHGADATRIVEALLELEGVEVFSEETRRFVGMEYGDAPAPEPSWAEAPAPALVPAAAPEPVVPSAAEPVVLPAEPSWAEAPAPAPVPAAAPEPVVPSPAEPAWAETPVPQAQPAVAATPEPSTVPTEETTPEKAGFFKRVFGRR